MKENLIGLSDRIWANPETRYKEYKAYSWLSSFLETNGFTVERSIGGLIPVSSLEECLAIKALEFTLLNTMPPDIGHAGHNIIGVSHRERPLLCKHSEAAKKPATISVYGCPAEEGGGGKVYMAKADSFQTWT